MITDTKLGVAVFDQQHELSFGVLGAVAAWRGEQPLDLGWPRQQAVLAVLLLEPNRPVAVPTLIDAVWGEAAPQGVRNTVQTNISRLRRALRDGERDGPVVRTDAGYLLRARASQVDVLAFEQELAAAGEHRRTGDLTAAAAAVESALGRWRGEAFTGLDGPYLRTQRLRLAELRLTAQELWAELRLARGEHTAVVAELTALVNTHPLRERLRELLMLGLHRAGRSAEALAAFQDARATLSERLGTDPGPRLRELHQRILASAPEPSPAPTRVVLTGAPAQLPAAPAQLPAAPCAFTGRAAELRELLTAEPGEVIAIDGMPGVGKTALALHAAHTLAPRYPDGQINLRLGETPLDPLDALATLLRALGVPTAQIPAELPDRAARWRAELRQRRLLLVLDDATGHEQLRPLLPGPGRCLVLITSRRRLTALESVRTLELGPMPAEEASELFQRLAGRRGPESDPVALAELTELCGGLPLAISLLAGRLRHHRRWTLRYLVDVLAAAGTTLGQLHAEDRSLTAAFERSYLALSPDQRRLFRFLAVLPGDEIDPHTAAALAGLEVAETRHELEQLYEHHLLTESAPGRYLLHELLQEYAQTLLDAEDPAPRQAAVGRLLAHYLHTTRISAQILTDAPLPGPEVAADSGALAWLDRERANLAGCLSCPGVRAHAGLAIALTTALHPHLRSRGHWYQSISLHQAALALAEDTGDEPGRAAARHHLGALRRLTGDFPGALHELTEALACYRALGHPLGEAGVLTELGALHTSTGEHDTAAGHLHGARRRYRMLDNPLGQAHAHLHLGALHHQLGEHSTAATHLDTAQHRYRALANPLGQAHALTALGHLHTTTGDLPAALATLTEARAGYRALGDELGQATARSHLGEAHRRHGEHSAAHRELTQALNFFTGAGDPLGQATTRHRLATLHLATGHAAKAATQFRQSLALTRQLGARPATAAALTGLGHCLIRLGEPVSGAEQLRQAVLLLAELGSPEATAVGRALAALPEAG